jgi:hypothetical protein
MTRPLALAAVIGFAVLARLLPHPPNFAPITAAAVFGGVTYLSRRPAVLVPLAALLASDLIREVLYRNGLAQQWGLYRGMWVVYGTTALVALTARLARGSRSPAAIAGVTLAGSCLFFLVTNFAVWADGSLYPPTAEGLAACYAAAVPFFRNALLGDACYAAVLFGVWAVAEARIPALRPASATAWGSPWSGPSRCARQPPRS